MKWLIALLAALLILATGVNGQTTTPANANNADNEDRTILLRNEFTGGVALHSSGWGIMLRRGKQKTVKKKRYIEFDFVSMKDPKEVRSQNPYYDNSTSYIYGKLNDFYVPRIGVGSQNIIFAKAHTTGVEVRYHYSVGAAMGITKPIYLNILEDAKTYNPSTGTYTYYPDEKNIVIERYDPVAHTPDVIYGNASFTYGLGEMSLHPGGYIKSGLSFEYAKYADQIWSIETGAVLDIFPKAIPIMAFIPNHQVFLNFYVALSYGGKW